MIIKGSITIQMMDGGDNLKEKAVVQVSSEYPRDQSRTILSSSCAFLALVNYCLKTLVKIKSWESVLDGFQMAEGTKTILTTPGTSGVVALTRSVPVEFLTGFFYIAKIHLTL